MTGTGAGAATRNVHVDCGWGRLIFGQTFDDAKGLIDVLRDEGSDRRDIGFYIRDPHVVLAHAPQEVFLDPSHSFRLDLARYDETANPAAGIKIRRLSSRADARAMNRIYQIHGMVQVSPDFVWANRDSAVLTYLLAEDEATGAIVGTVMGVDNAGVFDDPDNGSSLWCLAVDPQTPRPRVGEMLVRRLAEHFRHTGRSTMDLSVLHDNGSAIALYEKLGFQRLRVFAVKRKNEINERLFVGATDGYECLNPYARIIVDEARRRGIHAEVTDAEGGFFRLSYGGRSIHCRESLSELTSGVAVSVCDDKAVTRRIVRAAGVVVPEQIEAGDDAMRLGAFIETHGSIVVKPARGEQGRGVAVGITSVADAEKAIAVARTQSERVLLEACFQGEDLRLVMIDYVLVAAALRKPPIVVGDGRSTIRQLIEHLSRRRSAATSGESRVPIDAETERCVEQAGWRMDDIIGKGEQVSVRRTANLHTGGTIHDVTADVHPDLVAAAVEAARAIAIPVCGIDFMVKSPQEPDYVFIEANERPGLANHEPQPTAERFVDLLFPQSVPASARVGRTS
ncbi:GNAT family N-acetyltransferase [Aureimonas sp. SA4125]|uniref:N-acetylglutaminylglutamine synthetase n=1 Tax=Aureimonas sp. SA4125 TaxID=2826993 RepID=UPI001CC6D06F|nr:N-acetylglutaminylglutamine synthetase [Aureimonas sp. SA4125]BDA85373.1 GNAT family N-acetyltransferase [Aureimonas sp. SA4125]